VTLRVGIQATTEDIAPVLLADELGELAEENITVRFVPIADPGELYGALGTGQLDAVVGDLDAPFFDLVDQGTGVKLVLGGAVARGANDLAQAQPGFWIRSDQLTAPDHFKDLENDHFALQDGIVDAVADPITAVLRQDDLSLNEVHIDQASGAEAVKLLQDGKVTGAWLPEPAWRSLVGDNRFRLIATLPASETLSGVALSARLTDHDRDRAVGLAFVRAIIRTINTDLANDYQKDAKVMRALATATGIDRKDLAATPPWLFDWELRAYTTERMQTTFIRLGAVLYEQEIPERDIVDRTLYRDAVASGSATAPS
jgi:NitT/TauT family transport system substrate-binding protein